MSANWVNAVVEVRVPLDGVSVTSPPFDKQVAAEAVADRVLAALPEDLRDSACASHWEDVHD